MRPLEYSEDLVLDLARASGLTPAEIEESLASAHAAVSGCMAALLQAYRMNKELSTLADLMLCCKHQRATNGGIGKPNPDFYNMASKEGRSLREEYLKLQTAWRMTAKEIRAAFNQATWFAANCDEIDLNLSKPTDANDPEETEDRTEARVLLDKVRSVIGPDPADVKREKKNTRKTRKAVKASYVVEAEKKEHVDEA